MKHQGRSTSIELSVDGMHCGGCVSRVEKALGAYGSISSVDVDLAAGHVSVTGLDSLRPDALIATLFEAGFTASLATDSVDPGTTSKGKGCCH